jgi:FkbM family methyltransferase
MASLGGAHWRPAQADDTNKPMLKRWITAAALRFLPLFQGETRGIFLSADRTGRTTGARIKWRSADPEVIEGSIATFAIDSQKFRFFVADAMDVVQSWFVRGRFYEEEELALVRRHFAGGLFVDVGANVGNHAIFAARVLRAPKVVAFEPNGTAAELCEINLALNGCSEIVELRRVGLSDAPGDVRLQKVKHNLGGSRIGATGTDTIRVERGDDLLAAAAVSFIKIDVEGHELSALRGLRATIDRCRPQLFVEVENGNVDAFRAMIDECGYRVVEEFRRYDSCTNFLALPAETN